MWRGVFMLCLVTLKTIKRVVAITVKENTDPFCHKGPVTFQTLLSMQGGYEPKTTIFATRNLSPACHRAKSRVGFSLSGGHLLGYYGNVN